MAEAALSRGQAEPVVHHHPVVADVNALNLSGGVTAPARFRALWIEKGEVGFGR